jgi:hypothetical protein
VSEKRQYTFFDQERSEKWSEDTKKWKKMEVGDPKVL